MKEFASPYEEYKQARSDSKQALLRRQIAEEGPVAASRAAEKLARLKLDDESHSRLGRAIGVGLGVAPGFALGRGNASSIAWGALTGLAGAGIGQAIGGSIRKNKDKNLSANLKSALHELSARSEHGVKEFALVRDANGQLVEGGGGSGFKTAAKVGLGAAAVGGAAVLGTREYHGYKAIKQEGGIGNVWRDAKKMGAAGDAKGLSDLTNRLKSNAQASARAGWLGKLGKVGNVLTKFSANLKPALRELSDRSEGLVEFARGDFLRQAVGKYSDVAPAVVPGVSPSVVGPRGKEWRSQFLLWARKRAAKQMV